jgi:hypothetical protein
MAVLLAAAAVADTVADTAVAQPRIHSGSQLSGQPAPIAGAELSGVITTTGGAAPPFSPISDPFADPRSRPAAPIVGATPLPASAPAQFGPMSGVEWGVPGAVGEGLRFLQSVQGQYTWLRRGGANGLGVDEAEVWATFAIPSFLYNPAPLLVTPGFGLHMWNGPAGPDLPAQTYDSYIDLAWQPQIPVGGWLQADLGFSAGVYTDFDTLNSNSVRFKGRALLSFKTSDTVEWKGGVIYLDRLDVKILPAGGIIWTNHPDPQAQTFRYEIFFPKPKLAHRLWETDLAVWWGYVGGEYGGGSWTIHRLAGGKDQFDYNDIRVAVGLDRFSHFGVKSFVEMAYVFNREVIYRSATPTFKPSSTVMVRGGFRY